MFLATAHLNHLKNITLPQIELICFIIKYDVCLSYYILNAYIDYIPT